MTRDDVPAPPVLECSAADDLAGAMAFDALESAEQLALLAHLSSCDRPHEELRTALGAGILLAESLDPVAPSAALRARIMDSIGSTVAADNGPARVARAWLRGPLLLRSAAAIGVAAALVLAVWNAQLQSELRQRDADLAALAAAIGSGEPAHAVSGTAGNGYLLSGAERDVLIAAVPPLPADRLYQMWLLDAAGTPVSVGTFTVGEEEIVIAELERPIIGYAVFAVTVEAERMDAPTSDPILAATL